VKDEANQKKAQKDGDLDDLISSIRTGKAFGNTYVANEAGGNTRLRR
jgi:hypothetical protein